MAAMIIHWVTMKAVHRGIKNIGVGLTRSTISSLIPLSFPVKGASKWRPHGSGADRATSMASSWIENPTDKDRPLLKHSIQPAVSGVKITMLT